LSPDDILKGEVDESVEKVKIALKVLHAFRKSFNHHKSIIETYFKVNFLLFMLIYMFYCMGDY